MIKRVVFLSFLFPVFTAVAMVKRLPEKVVVSTGFAKDLCKINNDIVKLINVWDITLNEMAKGKNPDDVPSKILTFYSSEEGVIDFIFEGEYKLASWYMKNIVSRHIPVLDKVFSEKRKELKDIRETWKWFRGYFLEEGLAKPFAQYKLKALDIEKKMMKTIRNGDAFELALQELNQEDKK